MADARGEPTMEEILASIRRIIAEEPAPPRAPMPRKAAKHPSPEPDSISAEQPVPAARVDFEAAFRAARADYDIGIPPMPENGPAYSPAEIDNGRDDADADEEEVLELTQVAAPEEAAPDPVILSAAAASAAAERLSHFAQAMGEPGGGQVTLEGLVREMLRPMLKQWLDANLPDIVDQVVSREIARLTGKGR